jgi:predicted  nucleic acid-binding Zn-ribbon protein
MPHQCVRCNTLYQDGSQEILRGCKCGARLFFYIKKKEIEEGKELINNLTDEDKLHIEEDIAEILHIKEEPERPVVLDIEAIRVLKPGKYELDLVHLFKKDPLIVKLDEGKYIIDVAQLFKELEGKKELERKKEE